MTRTFLISASVAIAFGGASAFAMPAGHKMDHPMDMSKDAPMNHADTCGMPMAEGVINALDVARSKVKIAHEPIASIGWPAMNMEFAVLKPVDLAAFDQGDEVHFLLAPQKDKSYRVAAMCAADAEKSAHEACMKSMHEAAMKLAAQSGKPCDMKMDDGQMPGMDHKEHSSLGAAAIELAHGDETDDEHCKDHKDHGDGHDHDGDGKADGEEHDGHDCTDKKDGEKKA